jgi:hypothetical protein
LSLKTQPGTPISATASRCCGGVCARARPGGGTYCFSSLFLSLLTQLASRVNRWSKSVEREPKRVGAAGLVALSMRQSVSPVLSTPDADRRSSHREPLNRTRGLEGHGAVGLAKLRPDSSRAALEQSRASVASRARFVGWTRGPFARYIAPECWSHMSALSKGNQPLTGSKICPK